MCPSLSSKKLFQGKIYKWRLIAKQRHQFKDNIKMGVTESYEVGGCVHVRRIEDGTDWEDFLKQ